jgi:hypothetical protein
MNARVGSIPQSVGERGDRRFTANLKNATMMMAVWFNPLFKKYRNKTEICQNWDCRRRKNEWEQSD